LPSLGKQQGLLFTKGGRPLCFLHDAGKDYRPDAHPRYWACAFFTANGRYPCSAAETTELFAFLEAAEESKRQGGVPVKLETVLGKVGAK
jgi:hypothetical protein